MILHVFVCVRPKLSAEERAARLAAMQNDAARNEDRRLKQIKALQVGAIYTCAYCLYACAYDYVYTYINVHMYIYIHTYIYIYKYIHAHMYAYVYVSVFMFT
jgi:hypothetical protein